MTGCSDADGAAYSNPIPLVDSYRILYPDAGGSGTSSGFEGNPNTAKIDYVLVEAGAASIIDAEIIRTNREGRYPSDHFPVAAIVEWQ